MSDCLDLWGRLGLSRLSRRRLLLPWRLKAVCTPVVGHSRRLRGSRLSSRLGRGWIRSSGLRLVRLCRGDLLVQVLDAQLLRQHRLRLLRPLELLRQF